MYGGVPSIFLAAPRRLLAAGCWRGVAVAGRGGSMGGSGRKTSRGRQKQIDGPPRTFAKSQTYLPTCRLFFLGFVLVNFWAFLGTESSKTPQECFYKKSHVENLLKQIDHYFHVRFSSIFFCCVSGCFSATSTSDSDGSKKHTPKNVLQKNHVESF
jgi:hypothetical protein